MQAHHIIAKYGGALNLPCIKFQDCVWSFTTCTLYLFKTNVDVYLESEIIKFPPLDTQFKTTYLEETRNQPNYNLQLSLGLLYKLLIDNITNNSQFTMPKSTHLMSSVEFKQYHDISTKLI